MATRRRAMTKVTPHTKKMIRVLKQSAPRSRQLRDPFTQQYSEGGVIEPPFPPDTLMMLVEENAIHSGCINAKASDAVGRGWTLDARGKRADPAFEDDLRDLLDDICPEESFSELLFMAASEEDTLGWSAWEIVRQPEVTGTIGAIYYIPGNTIRLSALEAHQEKVWVQIVEGEQRYFVDFGSDFIVDANTGEVEIDKIEEPASELLVFRRRSRRSPWYGTPRWISAVPAIAELTAIREFNVSFFASGGLADRHIHVTANDVDTANEIAQAIDQTLRENTGRAHLTITTYGTPETAVEVKPLSPTSGKREGQFLARRADLIKEVLTAHNVPPYRIGLAELGSLGGSAAREMMRAYRVGSVEPEQTQLQNRLSKTLFNPKLGGLNLENYRWKLKPNDFDETELSLKLATQSVAGMLFTPNEGRKILGKPPINHPAMDKVYSGTNAITIDQQTDSSMTQVPGTPNPAAEAQNDPQSTGETGNNGPGEGQGGGSITQFRQPATRLPTPGMALPTSPAMGNT